MFFSQLTTILVLSCFMNTEGHHIPGSTHIPGSPFTTTPAPTTQVPTTPSPNGVLPAAGCPDPLLTFQNAFLAGGTVQTGVTTLGACQRACILSSTCRALSFQDSTSMCVFFTLADQDRVVYKFGWVHQQKTQCNQEAGAATGFITCSSGLHIFNGVPNAANTMTACQDACAADSTCQAVDFDLDLNACFFHTVATSCGTLQQQANAIHCKKTECSTNFPPTTAPTGFFREFIGYTIPGGTQVTGTFTLQECLDQCPNTDGGCQGVEYDAGEGSCFKHTSSTSCMALVAQGQITSFRKTGIIC